MRASLLGRQKKAMAFAVAGSLLAGGGQAQAQALPDNNYAIDLYQGPILAPIRVTGIAGAYSGYAEGIAGFVSNAAAAAVREPFNINRLNYDLAGSLSIPLNLFENNDFDNSGDVDFDYSNFIYGNLGGLIQYDWFGIGTISELQRYSITAPDGETNAITVGRYHVLVGWQLLGGQLNLGGGVRALSLSVDAPDANLTIFGASPEIGFLIRPDWESFRIGGSYRFPVRGGELVGDNRKTGADGVDRAGGLVLPDEVVLPWEAQVGIAIQVGPRPINPEWLDPIEQERDLAWPVEYARQTRQQAFEIQLRRETDPIERRRLEEAFQEREPRLRAEEDRKLSAGKERLEDARRARYDNWPRERLLLTAELLISGAVDRGVSVEQFVGQNQETASTASVVGTSGANAVLAPRVGIETEPVINVLATRFGSYYEPTRFSGPVGRQHFTFGADLRLFSTTYWGLIQEITYKLQASLDVAPRYQSFSVGVGAWH